MKAQLTSYVSGKVAAVFIVSSVSIIMIGIFTYMRKQLPWLEIYSPAGTFSGIWFYTYIIWAVLWIGLFLVLRNKENMGTIKNWLILFLISLAVSTLMIEASLNWSLVFG